MTNGFASFVSFSGPKAVIASAVVTALIVLSGCASTRPVRHDRVGFFDQLTRADREATRIKPRKELKAVNGDAKDSTEETSENAESRLMNEPADEDVRLSQFKKRVKRWQWPLRIVDISSPFGNRGKTFHEGVDLRAKIGTPVYAVDSGTVFYSGRKIRGYGEMIIIRHPSGLFTLYAHNSKLMVHKGQQIKAGQRISMSGMTGHADGPHLHFEVRDGQVPVDPMKLLPAQGQITAGIAGQKGTLAGNSHKRPTKHAKRRLLARNTISASQRALATRR